LAETAEFAHVCQADVASLPWQLVLKPGLLESGARLTENLYAHAAGEQPMLNSVTGQLSDEVFDVEVVGLDVQRAKRRVHGSRDVDFIFELSV
jgi:hypothetical protein